MSRIRTNIITNRMANGAPTVSNGLVISGVTTTSDIRVGTGATLNVYGGANFSGIVTAASFSGGVKVISDGTSTEQKRIDLFNYKLVGIIRSNETSFISLINQDGENITLEMNETLNDGVKLIDMNQKEAIFLVEESDSYLIMNFKNEIKETSEY